MVTAFLKAPWWGVVAESGAGRLWRLTLTASDVYGVWRCPLASRDSWIAKFVATVMSAVNSTVKAM